MAGNFRQSASYGRGLASIQPTGLHDRAEVVGRLRSLFRDPAYTPPRMPDTALKLLQMTRSFEIETSQITRVLEEDQLLAAEVLRLAQSAQFSGKSAAPILSLDEALVRLGTRRTAEAFLQASMNMRVFRVKGYQRYMDQLRRHSALVAQLARLIGRHTSLYDEHAFLCGLLHDVGMAAALIAFAEATPRDQTPPDFAEIWPALLEAHEEAGGALARLWKLPPEVQLAIEHHHGFLVKGRCHPTAAIIEIANGFAEEVGLGLGQESTPASFDRAVEELGLSPRQLAALRVEARELAAGSSES